MSEVFVALCGSLGTVAFFGFLAFAVWINYRKEKEARETASRERLKAMELGYPPADAEIERVKAYASAAWAAGVIGLVVPIVIVSLGIAATIVAIVMRQENENLGTPLCIAWGIGGAVILVTVVRCLGTIRQLPRPEVVAPQQRPPVKKREDSASEEYQEKRLEL